MIVTQTIRLLFKCKTALIIAAILPTIIIVNNIPHVLADPAHCDQSGWPLCYDVGYSDGQQNPGTSCPSGHSDNFCGGWAAGATSSSASSSSISTSHTAAYWAGFNQGKLDREHGTPEPAMDMCDSADFHGIDHDHCVVGYLDGLDGRSP